MNEKHIKMYMRQAREMANPEHNDCLSRSIGAVVVKNDQPGGRIVSTGFNGPAAGLPRPDTEEHLMNVTVPQLTEEEFLKLKRFACDLYVDKSNENGLKLLDDETGELSVKAVKGCKTCPRRMVGAPSGSRLELCGCAHAERNAIYRSSESLLGCTIFCWCPLPCWDCSVAIVQSGIKHVVCMASPDYSVQSRWILSKGGVTFEYRDPETLDFVPVLEFNKQHDIERDTK